MGDDGYLLLTDFGLAKDLNQIDEAFTYCGTPSYMAPEILDQEGYSYAVDWWALGILTYQLIVG